MRKEAEYIVSPELCAKASYLSYYEKLDDIDSYINNNFLHRNSWHRFGRNKDEVFISPKNGYIGLALVNDSLKIVIIAHRGTDASVYANLWDDYSIAFSDIPLSHADAEHFSASVRNAKKGYTFIETGHSLGAIHAELNSGKYKCKAITFESPGCLTLFKNNPSQYNLKQANDNITTYLAAPNLINTCDGHVGKIMRIYVDHGNRNGAKIQDCIPFVSTIVDTVTLKWTQGIGGLAGMISKHTLRQHSMDNIKDLFNTEIGEPYLQAEMSAWPELLRDYVWWAKNSMGNTEFFRELLHPIMRDFLDYNITMESLFSSPHLTNYKIRTFYVSKKMKSYKENIWTKFGEFYCLASNTTMKVKLEKTLGAVEVERNYQIRRLTMKRSNEIAKTGLKVGGAITAGGLIAGGACSWLFWGAGYIFLGMATGGALGVAVTGASMIISHLTSKGTLERSEGKTLTLTQENKTLRLRAEELEELIKKPKHEFAKINDAQKKQIALLEADLKARDKEIAKLKNDLAIANKEIARNSAAIDLLMKDYNARKRKEPLSDNNASSDDEAEEAFHASKKPKKPPVRRLIHNSSSTKHKTLDDDSYKHKPLFSKPKGRKVPGPIHKTVKPRPKH